MSASDSPQPASTEENSASADRESLTVAGGELADHIRDIIHEGNVRHVVIRNGDHVIMEIPVTVGLIGLALAPLLATVAAAGALLTHCTVEIVREPETPTAPVERPHADLPPSTGAEGPQRTHLD